MAHDFRARREIDSKADLLEAALTPHPPSVQKLNILIVDDRPEKLTALQAVLDDLGQNIITANSGKDALRLLLKNEFAVILLDVNMPGMDGFETAALIRQRKSSEHTPIIFVTAISTSDNYIYKGYSLGAVDYIFVPIVPEVLRAKVSVFVELSRKTEQAKWQAEQLRQMEETEHRRRLSQANERLEVETTRNRFFQLAVDLLGIANFDALPLQVNPSWTKILGYSEEELKARPLIELVHPEDRHTTEDHMELLRTAADARYFENRLHCRDGTYRWIGWTIAPFQAERLLYLFGRDITQRKEVEHALQDTNTELESFSYTVSHDLRAPLRAMQGFADALLQDYADKLDTTATDYAQRIVQASRRLDTLIQDLLVYSRLNRAELNIASLDLESPVKEAITQLEDEIRSRHALVDVEKPLPQGCGHHATLVQVITNLLGNALKFVPPQGIPHVKIRSETVDDRVRLWVEDNGIGIAPEHQSRIFRVFERLHGNESYPGTGIGLAIVRKGMERMGGKVGVESVPAQGSRFWIELAQPENA